MPGSKRQLDNIENFVRKNATFHAKQNPNPEKRFKCKDCTNEYDTFQALGGHCTANHKFVTLYCNVCGKGFLTGQALGGHMGTHSSKKKCKRNDEKVVNSAKTDSSENLDSVSCLKIANVGTSCKKVLKFDLNFTPEENESKDNVKKSEQDSWILSYPCD